MADSSVIHPKPTAVYVAPLSKLTPADVNASIHAMDVWLKQISGGVLSVEALKTVAAGVPILSNIFAAADVVMDVKAMVEHGSKPIDVFDWTNLGLDLIGVVPMPPATAEIRVAARPMLKIIRQEVAKSGKAVLESSATVLRDAVIGAIVSSLNERFAGEIETFIAHIKQGLAALLQHCADFISKLMTAFADLFAQAAGEKGFNIDGNLHAAGQHAREVKAGLMSYDARKIVHGAGGFIVDFLKVEVKGGATLGTKAVKLLDPAASHRLMAMSHDLRGKIPATVKYVRGLDGNEIGKIGWLIEIGTEGVARWRKTHLKNHVTGIPSHGQAKVVAQRGQGRNEAISHCAPARHPGAGDCKCGCPKSPPARTASSIGYAFGDERIQHDDFVLDGPVPLVWQRTYRSFFDAYDTHGELGARWITPYTTRFDIHASKLVYHGADGRSLDYPLLAPGEAKDDLAESFTLLRLDDRWLTLTRGPELVEAYERDGERFRLAFLRDIGGNQLTLDYDASGRLSRILAADAIAAFHHDGAGRIVEIVHHDIEGVPVEVLARYAYDGEGDLVAATDRYNNRRAYRYRHHLVTHYTDRTGRGIHLEWDGTDAKARCFREWADDGSHAVTLDWHPDFRMVSVTDALDGTSQHYYDIKGLTFRILHPDGSEEWMLRDEHDNLTQYIHRDGSVEHMRYDARGNLVEHQRTDGSTIEMRYDDRERLIAVTDPHGHVWYQEHDDAGNLTARIDPLGRKTEFSHDAQGRVNEIKDAKGGVTQFVHDAAGRILSKTDCSGKTTRWSYDAQGRLIRSEDAAGAVATFAYGENGRPVEVRTPAGIERVVYDAEGRLLSHTDPLDRTLRLEYDAAGRLCRRVDALGQVTRYRYDRLGRIVELIDARSASHRFEYDAMSRIVGETGFDGRTIRYAYRDADGLLEQIDDAGQIVTIGHDRAGRPSTRTAAEETERVMFDASGRWIDAGNAHSRTQRFFDPVGNLVREHHVHTLFGESRSYVWHHEYDELGNRVRTVRPDGHRIDWLTYGSGHVHGMMLDGIERVQFERDDLHRETARTLPSRVGEESIYDPAGRLVRRAARRGGAPAPFAARDYRYDAAGNLIGIDDGIRGSITYRYDPVGQLLEAHGPAGREHFAFDAVGNLTSPSGSLVQRTPFSRHDETAEADETGRRLADRAAGPGGAQLQHDARGNLIRARFADGERHYQWDAWGRLATSRSTGPTRSMAARYYYDALGRRIAKEVDGERTVFGWDGDRLAYETRAGRSTHYVYEPGTATPLLQFVTGPVTGLPTPATDERSRYTPEDDPLQRIPERTSEAVVFHYHCDHIGTPLLMSDEAGEVVWEAAYKAWGGVQSVVARASTAAGIVPGNALRFQGQQFDDETGLHYNRFRYYDPGLGRFVSEDPIGLKGGPNPYQYAPNPIAYIDPLGLARGKCFVYWYGDIGGASGHYSVKTVAGTGSTHTHQRVDENDETWIAKTNSLELGEPTNSATFDLPDVGAAQRYQRDEVQKSRDINHSDGKYEVQTNSCMTHVTDVLNAGGANVPATGKRAWAFLNQAGVGPRPK